MKADWGSTPLANATVRGFVIAVILGLLAGANAYWRDGMTANAAVGEAIIPMLSSFVALLTYGLVDQQRANTGTVIASDVPVQITAKARDWKPSTVIARDYGPKDKPNVNG